MQALAMTDPFASGVLKQDVHSRLVADLPAVAKDASIMPEWIWKPLAKSVGQTEYSYVVKFRQHRANRAGGLCYVGRNPSQTIDDRMSAITGALVRNFIRAKVMTLEQVLAHFDDHGAPPHSCIAIPNFFIEKGLGGGKLADWKIGQLMDLLTQRRIAGLQTVVYVSDLDCLANEYGVGFANLIKQHYIVVKAD